MPSIPLSEKTLEFESSMEKKSRKEKKSKKVKLASSESEAEELKLNSNDSSEMKKSKKKDKKRKAASAAEIDEVEERSETSSESGEPVNLVKTKKKAKLMDVSDDDEEKKVEKEHATALGKFRISEKLKAALEKNGIMYLFPIQAMTFDTILNGFDMVGRAKTGQGKTLAFILPILESLTSGPAKGSRNMGYGRAPSVLVLLPTRELAMQVFKDFEVYGKALGLNSCCLYGQTPYHKQKADLQRGVDVVVATPGRIKDLLQKEYIDLSLLRFRVLDEADEMLKMGFVDDVELILGKVKDASKVQTLLFSATMPDWVKQLSSKFLKPDKKTADLVGNEKMKASGNVRHIVLPCSGSALSQVIPDIISCYSSGGLTIIFTEKRESASQLSGLLPGSRALHGDIQQNQREVTLAAFRAGKFKTLVCTNVGARGLDIDNVQLIIQCEPPRLGEDYIHRSGRTGRAGNTGVSVMLYDPRRSNISKIQREAGVKFEHISAPQPADIAKAVGALAAENITQISDSVIPAFKAAAEELLSKSGLSPAELLAKALATASGYTEIKSRSILTSMENHVTVQLECGRPIYTPSFAFSILRRFLPEEKVESIKGFALTADGNGAVFDVAAEDLDTFLNGQKSAPGVSLNVVTSLPQLQEREPRRSFGGGGGRFSGGRGGYSDRFSRGGQSGGRGSFSRKW